MKHLQTSDIKKAILFFLTVVTAVFSNAQVKAVRCTEEDYNQALQSRGLCSCSDFTPTNLSQIEIRKIDSVLHQHYFVADGFNEADFDLEWKRMPYQHTLAAYIVEFRVINKGLEAPVDTKTAFIDSIFRPMGTINGGLMGTDCCIRQIATQEINHLSLPPFLYIYRWESDKSIPELLDQYFPTDFLILEYCYSITGELFVKGKEFHTKGSVVYVKVRVE